MIAESGIRAPGSEEGVDGPGSRGAKAAAGRTAAAGTRIAAGRNPEGLPCMTIVATAVLAGLAYLTGAPISSLSVGWHWPGRSRITCEPSAMNAARRP